MAPGLRNVLEQLVAVGKTSSPFSAEVDDGKLAAIRTIPQVSS
jgi:hypothetical protein